MYRIDNSNAVAVPPAAPGASTGGYFTNGSPPTTSPTEVDDWWLNQIQEELVAIATMAGGTLTKGTNNQCMTAIEGYVRSGIESGETDTSTVSTHNKTAVIASMNSRANNSNRAFVIGGDGCVADGNGSGVVASLSSGGNGFLNASGFRTFVAASVGASGKKVEALGYDSAILAARTTASDVKILATAYASAIIAADDGTSGSTVNGLGNAIVASSGVHVQHANSKYSAAVASTDSDVAGDGIENAFVAGSDSSQASANQSSVMSSTGSLASGVKSAAIACADAVVSGEEAAMIASDDGEAAGLNTSIISSTDCENYKPQSSILSSENCFLVVGSGDHGAMLSSRNAELAQGYAVALGYHADTTPTVHGSNQNLTIILDAEYGHIEHDGTISTPAADYAEMFATDGEIPAGRLVKMIDGGGVALASAAGDEILGITSAAPTVLGNAAPLGWGGRYAVNDFGEYIVDDFDLVKWSSQITDDGEVLVEAYDGLVSKAIDRDKWPADAVEYTLKGRRENPDYDPTQTYVPRKDRPAEWAKVGLLGQLRLAVTKDVKPGDAIKGSAGGVGAPATTSTGRGVRVMSIVKPYDKKAGYGVALCFVG